VADARVRRARRGVIRTWKRLIFEQRVAAVGALLLIVSTLGPFSFVEAAEVVMAVGVLALLRARAEGGRFRLPVRDGTAILAAGAWAALLIVVRLFDRPLGQNLLALACAAILALAGLLERAKDRRPEEPAEEPPPPPSPTRDWGLDAEADVAPTARLPVDDDAPSSRDADTEPLPPPEFRPPSPGGPATSAGRRGGRPPERQADEDQPDPDGGELEPGGGEERPG
jgi:hypothetical protein